MACRLGCLSRWCDCKSLLQSGTYSNLGLPCDRHIQEFTGLKQTFPVWQFSEPNQIRFLIFQFAGWIEKSISKHKNVSVQVIREYKHENADCKTVNVSVQRNLYFFPIVSLKGEDTPLCRAWLDLNISCCHLSVAIYRHGSWNHLQLISMQSTNACAEGCNSSMLWLYWFCLCGWKFSAQI